MIDGLRVDHPDGLADPAGYLRRLRRRGRGARLGREDPPPRRGAARLAGRGHRRLRVPQRRGGAVRRPGRRGRADRPLRRADGRDAGVRRGRARGPGPAGDDDVRARGRAAALAARRAAASPTRWRRCPSTARTSSRGRGASRTTTARRSRRRDRRALADALLLARARPRRVRHALPADLAAGDGEGRRGHRLLPLRPPARAQRGRRRPGPLRAERRRSSTPRTPIARGALPRAACSSPRRTTRSARATSARGSARWPGWRPSGASTCCAGASVNAPLRAGGAPDANEEYLIYQTLVGAWPIERRPPRGVPREGAARGQAQHELGRAGPRLGGPGQALRRGAARPRPFLDDFEPFAARVADAGRRSALGQLLLKLTVARRRRHLPGRRARGAQPRRPRQPPPGGLGRAPRRARRPARRRRADGRDDEAVPHLARAGPARARRPDAFAGAYEPVDAGAGRVRVPARRRGARGGCSCGRRAPRCCAASPGPWRDVLTGDERDLGDEVAVADVVDANGLALLERA